MSANARRGETAARFDGRDYRLCLTLGALAELEQAFAAENLGQLVERFAGGSLSAGDMTKILGAGLRGGGNAIADDEVRQMTAEDGAAGFARAVADLLTATFGGGKAAPTDP